MHLISILLFALINFLLISVSSGSNKDTNLGLTPIVNVKATYNTCFKCNQDSFVNKVLDVNPEISLNLTCNGFIYNELAYHYKIYINDRPELLVLTELHSFSALLNGNMLSITNGYVGNGTCIGDYVYSVAFAMADNQNGCNSEKGVRSQRVIWNMLQIIGKCNTICNGAGNLKLAPAISNKGPVE